MVIRWMMLGTLSLVGVAVLGACHSAVLRIDTVSQNALAVQDSRIDELIRELSDDSIEVRDRATQGLVDNGIPVVGKLRDRQERLTDAEAKARIHWVLCELDPVWEEKVVATLPPEDKSWSILGWPDSIFSTDGRQVAHHIRQQRGECVLLGNRAGECFTLIPRGIGFSPDGRTLVYEAWREDGKFLVAGNQKYGPYDELERHVFNPRTAELSFPAKRGGKWFLSTGEREGPRFDKVDYPVFSPDGNGVAYRATENGGMYIVSGERKLGPYEDLSNVRFTPDSKSLAYVIRDHGKCYVQVGDERSEANDASWDLAIGPDGKTAAYTDRVAQQGCVIVGGRRGDLFDQVSGNLVFSPSGKSVAYSARREDHWFIVNGERTYGPFDAISSGPVFASGASEPSFVARESRVRWLWVEGRKQEPLRGNRPNWPVTFSPDGSQAAYIMWVDDDENGRKGWRVCVGEAMSEVFDFAEYNPIFSPDGRKLAFGARRGRDLLWKVMDVK